MLPLKDMTVTEALRVAKETSGKTAKEIADALGMSRGVITRYLKDNDGYSPRMGMIPGLCRVLGNDILLQWLEVRIQEDREKRKEKILLHVAKMEKALQGVTLLLAMQATMTAEDEEEMYDLIQKIERECQRVGGLSPVPGMRRSSLRRACPRSDWEGANRP